MPEYEDIILQEQDNWEMFEDVPDYFDEKTEDDFKILMIIRIGVVLS